MGISLSQELLNLFEIELDERGSHSSKAPSLLGADIHSYVLWCRCVNLCHKVVQLQLVVEGYSHVKQE